MVRDTTENALKDAEGFLDSSKETSSPNRVRMTNLIHCVIRASDALLMYFGREKPSNHENTASKFNSLINDKGLMDDYGGYEKNIRDVLSEKTPAEYTGKKYRNKEVSKHIKKSERFLKAVKEITEQN